MKVRLTQDITNDRGEVLKKGHVNDRPDSFWWLGIGIAEPVDDEAKAVQAQLDARKERARKNVEMQAEQMRSELSAQQEAAEQEKLSAFEDMLREGT